MRPVNSDFLWVDLTRIVATFFIIMVHVCSSTINQEMGGGAPLDWWVGAIYASISRAGVPLFFMLSGFLLLSKKESLTVFFSKRMGKILIPLLSWSIVYLLWSGSGGITDVGLSLMSATLSPVHFHLWYLYAISGIYLFIPILRVFIGHTTRKMSAYFICLWFVAIALVPLLEKLLHVSSALDLNMISGYIGYLVIGYVLGGITFSRKFFIMFILLALLMIAVTVMGTFVLTVSNDGSLKRSFLNYLSPNVIVGSASIFIILKYCFEHAVCFNPYKNAIKLLSSSCFGIYLVHIIYLDILYNGLLGFVLSPETFSVLSSIPVLVIVIFIMSFFTVVLFRKISLLSKVV
ncbi:MAG: acyltransferase family protein [Colwellia sp.]